MHSPNRAALEPSLRKRKEADTTKLADQLVAVESPVVIPVTRHSTEKLSNAQMAQY